MADQPQMDAAAASPARTRRRGSFIIAALVLLAILLSRLPMALTALRGSELTTDEADLSLMAIDRFFGTPLTNTHWPAITNQILLMPLAGLDFLVSGQPRNANGFATFAGMVYRDPSHLIFAHRFLIIALNALATAAVCWSLRTRGLFAMLAAALLLQNAHLIVYGTMGLGNGTAMAAMIGVLACALHPGVARPRAILIGILFGLALASRNTSILLAPVIAAVIWEMAATNRERLHLAGLLLVGLIAGSAPAWSAAALDPIRWLKANLGNFAQAGNSGGSLNAVRALLSAGGWLFWAATIAAATWLLVRGRNRLIVCGWASAFVLAVVVSGRASVIETRYFDAIIVGAALLCVLAARDLAAVPARRPAIVLAASAVLAIVGWWSAFAIFQASRAGLYPQARLVVEQLHSPADGRPLIVDRQMLSTLHRRADAASLRLVADQTEQGLRDGVGLRDFVTAFHLEPSVASVFAQDLTEKERCYITRERAAALAPPIGEPLSFITAGDSNTARRFGSIDLEQAIAQVRTGAAAEAVFTAESVKSLDLTGVTARPLGDGTYVSIRRDSDARRG